MNNEIKQDMIKEKKIFQIDTSKIYRQIRRIFQK